MFFLWLLLAKVNNHGTIRYVPSATSGDIGIIVFALRYITILIRV